MRYVGGRLDGVLCGARPAGPCFGSPWPREWGRGAPEALVRLTSALRRRGDVPALVRPRRLLFKISAPRERTDLDSPSLGVGPPRALWAVRKCRRQPLRPWRGAEATAPRSNEELICRFLRASFYRVPEPFWTPSSHARRWGTCPTQVLRAAKLASMGHGR